MIQSISQTRARIQKEQIFVQPHTIGVTGVGFAQVLKRLPAFSATRTALLAAPAQLCAHSGATRAAATTAGLGAVPVGLAAPWARRVVAGTGPIEENKVWFTLFFGFFLPNPQPLGIYGSSTPMY